MLWFRLGNIFRFQRRQVTGTKDSAQVVCIHTLRSRRQWQTTAAFSCFFSFTLTIFALRAAHRRQPRIAGVFGEGHNTWRYPWAIWGNQQEGVSSGSWVGSLVESPKQLMWSRIRSVPSPGCCSLCIFLFILSLYLSLSLYLFKTLCETILKER